MRCDAMRPTMLSTLCSLRLKRQVCVHLPVYADNAALPGFARRMPLLLSAGRAAIDLCLLRQKTYSSGFAAVGP